MQKETKLVFTGLLDKSDQSLKDLTPNQVQSTVNRLDPVRKMQEEWQNLLTKSLDRDHSLDLEQLKNKEPFELTPKYLELKSRLDSLMIPAEPKMGFLPPKPSYKEPEITFSQKIRLKKRKILQAYEKDYDKKLESWQKIIDRSETAYKTKLAEYEKILIRMSAEREEIREMIGKEAMEYETERLQKNESTDILQINYHSKQANAVEEYFQMVMQRSEYPDFFPRNIAFEYLPDTQTLYVSAELPHPDQIPNKKIIARSNDNQEDLAAYETSAFSLLYNDIIFKIILRTFYEIISADKSDTVGSIGYNGWVRVLNKGNGRYENICIASLFATRAEFEDINLHLIEPASCFRYLKGISSTRLSDLIQVETPISIPHKNAAVLAVKKLLEPLDRGNNLANMNWHDFEKNLIDLLQWEFGTETNEIKLIHSSLETGIEAIATDSDPYRGGKSIFHIKRSIKPIPVSAVRELFGQVMHEGAKNGILFTTADFSTETYEFAKNKPLSLINGIGLLSLFQKYGIKLRINLREAISLESWLS
jgi:restriction system protein